MRAACVVRACYSLHTPAQEHTHTRARALLSLHTAQSSTQCHTPLSLWPNGDRLIILRPGSAAMAAPAAAAWLLVLVLATAATVQAKHVNISNALPRRDTTGEDCMRACVSPAAMCVCAWMHACLSAFSGIVHCACAGSDSGGAPQVPSWTSTTATRSGCLRTGSTRTMVVRACACVRPWRSERCA